MFEFVTHSSFVFIISPFTSQARLSVLVMDPNFNHRIESRATLAAATPIARLVVERIPSLAPGTEALNHPLLLTKWFSLSTQFFVCITAIINQFTSP
jgi:hypothetical protein